MQSQSGSQQNAVNHYSVLGLPAPHSRNYATISKDELKTAYHHALLLHHPDKAPKHDVDLKSTHEERLKPTEYSIDDIMRAYQTLLEPGLKAEYDKRLLSNNACTKIFGSETSQRGSHLGVETVDLDDLTYHEDNGQWFRSCRCGNEEGYTVTEAELEKESKENKQGEIYIGCGGCSLFIKVLFSSMDDKVTVEE